MAETWPRPPAARLIALANQKGGVGKSTSVVGLAGWLALEGARVLVIDLDPQANATSGLGIDSHRAASTSYRVMMEQSTIEDAVEPTSLKGLYCVPSSLDLAGAEIELVPAFSRELRLRKAVGAMLEDFDYIMIDCPPSLGLLTINALAAAQEVVIPVQCEYYALEGIAQLLNNITLIETNLNPTLRLRRFLLTMFDARTRLAQQVVQEVRQHFRDEVLEAVVPRSVRLSEAPSFGQPIALYAPNSKGGRAYRQAAYELAAAGVARSVRTAERSPQEGEEDERDARRPWPGTERSHPLGSPVPQGASGGTDPPQRPPA